MSEEEIFELQKKINILIKENLKLNDRNEFLEEELEKKQDFIMKLLKKQENWILMKK